MNHHSTTVLGPARLTLAALVALTLATIALALVAPAADAATRPVARQDFYRAKEDTLLVKSRPGVLANDAGRPIVAKLTRGVYHGFLRLERDGSFKYMPKPNYHGADSFAYKVCPATSNAACSAPTIVKLSVASVNDMPEAADDSYSTPEDKTLAVAPRGVLKNDTDVDGDALTSSLKTVPLHGRATMKADGSFTYTPNANYNGPDSFTYGVSDGKVAQSGTVNISVAAVSDPPVARNDVFYVKNGAYRFIGAPGPLENDYDPDGDPLKIIGHSQPNGILFTLYPGGKMVIRAPEGTVGPRYISYTISDGHGHTDTGRITLRIHD